MKKKMFKEFLQSVHEGKRILKNEIEPSRKLEIQTNVIKEIRLKHNLTQEKFAFLLGISIGTLKNWEQGHRKPTGPAIILLQIAQKNPEIIFANNFS